MALLCLLMLLLAAPAWARTLWVSPSGSAGSGCINSATPLTTTAKATLTQMITGCNLQPGDIVNVRAGTYTDRWDKNVINFPNGTSGNPITITGYSSERPIISPPGTSPLNVDDTDQWLVFRNLVFQCSSCGTTCSQDGYTVGTVSVSLSGSNNVLDNVEIRNMSHDAIEGFGNNNTLKNSRIHSSGTSAFNHGLYLIGDGWTIENNEFYNLQGSAIKVGQLAARNNVIRNNRLHDFGLDPGKVRCASPFTTEAGGGSGVTMAHLSENTLVYNNSVYNCRAQGANSASTGFYIVSTGIAQKVYNNTVQMTGANCTGLDYSNPSQGHIVRNNLLFTTVATSLNNQATGAGNTYSNNLCGVGTANCAITTTNPGFVGAAGGNFQLAAGSPALNQAANLSTVFTTDALGLTRPAAGSGENWDIGAFERTTAPQPNPIGMVARYPFDGNAQDASGRNHPGTLVGNAAATGAPILGTASLVLDGVGDRVTVPGHVELRPTGAFGLSAWIQGSTVGANGGVIVSNGAPLGMWLRPDGTLGCWIDGGGTNQYTEVISPNSVLNNAPHHLICTYSGTQLQAYIDNVLVGSIASTQTLSYTGTEGLWIGDYQPSPGLAFTGRIDEVRMDDTHYNAEAVANLFDDVPAPAGLSVTHSRFSLPNQLEGNYAAGTDQDLPLPLSLGQALGIDWAIHKSDPGSLTEYFRVFCRSLVAGAWGDWLEVTNSYGALGVRFYQDAAVSLGQATTAMLPLDGFTPVAGIYLENPVDTTAPYDAIQRVTISQSQHLELKARLSFDAPLQAGNCVQCRPQRENGEPFAGGYGGLDMVAIRTITMQEGQPTPLVAHVGGTTAGGLQR